MTTSSKERFDVYGAITDQIIASIEAGAEHPQMPWHRAGGSIERPTNVESKNAYRGVNTVALWASAYCQQFDHGLWGTYRQWQEKGAQVRKGEKSSIIIFYRDLGRMSVTRNHPAMMMIAAIGSSLRVHRACSTSHRSMALNILQSNRR